MTDSPNAGEPMLRSPSRTAGPPGGSAERMVRANEVELCVQAFGHAADPVILLIMGSAASMDWWEDSFCERLAAGRRRRSSGAARDRTAERRTWLFLCVPRHSFVVQRGEPVQRRPKNQPRMNSTMPAPPAA